MKAVELLKKENKVDLLLLIVYNYSCNKITALIIRKVKSMKTILFQGDSITDCGRYRKVTDKKENGIAFFRDGRLFKKITALGEGYPAKVVFIGPCTAKKAEARLESVKPFVDAVLTFEELQALYDSREIDITTLDEDVLDNASYFGRIFARSGGLSDAVKQGLKEQNIEFDLKAVACDGIEECKIALLKKSKNVLDANFIEGMACVGGCIGGAGCLTHGEKS